MRKRIVISASAVVFLASADVMITSRQSPVLAAEQTPAGTPPGFCPPGRQNWDGSCNGESRGVPGLAHSYQS